MGENRAIAAAFLWGAVAASSLLIGGPWGADLRGEAFRAARAELERRLHLPIPQR